MSGSAGNCLATLVRLSLEAPDPPCFFAFFSSSGFCLALVRSPVHGPTVLVFFSPIGYLSCCRFLSDNEILTSSGDMTWCVLGVIVLLTPSKQVRFDLLGVLNGMNVSNHKRMVNISTM